MTTALTFTTAEYDRRWTAVTTGMEAYGVDAVCVTARNPVRYLAGTDSYGTFVAPLIISPGHAPVYVVREYDEARVRTEARVSEIRSFFGEHDVIEVWADTLRSLGLDRARVGLELDLWELAPMDVTKLQAALPDLRVVDTSRLVQSVMDVKSAEEIAAMRRAMEFTVLAVRTFIAQLHEGAIEREVALSVEATLEAAGSEPMEPWELLFGRRTALPHGAPGAGRLAEGDAAFAELSGTTLGYCAGLCRTAVLGRNQAVEDLHGVARDALEAALATIRPGVTMGEVDAACRGVVTGAGIAKTARTGYSIGMGWMARGSTSVGPLGTEVILPGMTLHTPVNLFRSGEFGVGVSETVLVTETGIEVLSGIPRDIAFV